MEHVMSKFRCARRATLASQPGPEKTRPPPTTAKILMRIVTVDFVMSKAMLNPKHDAELVLALLDRSTGRHRRAA